MRYWKVVVAGAALLLGAGCVAPKHFPLGIYNVPEEELSAVKRAGFNLVVGGESESYLGFAKRCTLKVLAKTGARAGGAVDEATQKRVRRFNPHPAVWGWYVIDEPDLHKIPPKEVERLERVVKRAPTGKQTVVVVASAEAVRDYGHAGDYLLVDYYPIGWGTPAAFGEEMRVAKMARGEKKMGAVIQAFDWSYFPEVMEPSNEFRPPTYQELRCMTFLAAAADVDAIFYYSFKAGEWDLRHQTNVWHDLQRVVEEVNEKIGIFTGEHLWFAMNERYDEGKRWNAVGESAITKRLIRVERKTPELAEGDYLLLINTAAESIHYQFRLADVTDDTTRFAEHKRLVQVNDGWAERQFKPYEVVLIGPFKAKKN